MTVSLRNDEIIQLFSIPKLQATTRWRTACPTPPFFFLQDNDILHVITFFFVFLGEITSAAAWTDQKDISLETNTREGTRRRKGKCNVKRWLGLSALSNPLFLRSVCTDSLLVTQPEYCCLFNKFWCLFLVLYLVFFSLGKFWISLTS